MNAKIPSIPLPKALNRFSFGKGYGEILSLHISKHLFSQFGVISSIGRLQ
jgi:hypothetical protein